jgi:NTP pyrophosphatase (non-canonical NTP hydrolase)
LYLSKQVRVYEKRNASSKALDMLWRLIVHTLYANYDTEQAFEPQFEANAETVMQAFKDLEVQFDGVLDLSVDN